MSYKKKYRKVLEVNHRNLAIPKVLDELIIAESITRGLPISTVIFDILGRHFTHDTAQDRVLRAIYKAVTQRKKDCMPYDAVIQLADLPVSKEEIAASRYNRKKKVKRTFPDKEPDEQKADVFNLDTIKKPT